MKDRKEIHIYTDGAISRGKIGWGFVALTKKEDEIIKESYGKLRGDKELLAQRNVAGELAADTFSY